MIDLQPVGFFSDQFAQRTIEFEHLEHAEPATVAGAAATFASTRKVNALADLKAERAEPRILGELRCGQFL